MKSRILFLLTAIPLVALFCFTANAQVAGDYGSAASIVINQIYFL